MDENINLELQAAIDQARVAGLILDETEPRAIKAWYAADTEANALLGGRIFIELNTEIIMGFPFQRLQGLDHATPKQLAEVEITRSGYGLHWESLDVDLGVPALVAGLFGSPVLSGFLKSQTEMDLSQNQFLPDDLRGLETRGGANGSINNRHNNRHLKTQRRG